VGETSAGNGYFAQRGRGAYHGDVARMRIGELLVEAKLITREQLETGLAAQQKSGRKLGHTLIELGIVSETQLTQALSQQLSVPWVSLYHIDFSRELLNLVPQELAEKYCLVPVFVRRVRKQGETLYVAMDDPTHEAALAAVMQSSSLPVRPMISSPSDIRSAIRVYYGVDVPEVSAPSSTAPVVPKAPPVPEDVKPTLVLATQPETDAVIEPLTGEIVAVPAPPPSQDSPHAWPEVEAHTLDLPKRKGPRMVSLTLLDGTTIRVPAKPKPNDPAPAASAPGALTARDLIRTLRAVAQGADASEILGEKVPLEQICAALLSLLLKKGLLADWEFVDELRKT
jgi:type IV pilus assembly protein PilB